MTVQSKRIVSIEDVLYLKYALNIACKTDLSLDIPRLNRTVRELLHN